MSLHQSSVNHQIPKAQQNPFLLLQLTVMIRAGGFDHGDFSIFDLTDIGISDMDHLILAQ